MSWYERIVRNGRFTNLGALLTFFVGLSIIAGVVIWPVNALVFGGGICLGLVMIGLSGYEANASALGLPPPFTRDPLGWRKAKQSYEADAKQGAASDEQEKDR